MSLLKVINLKKKLGNSQVLDRLSFEVYRGQVLGILGANGTGKTTLLNTLSGLYNPDSGQIKIQDNIIDKYKPVHLSTLGIARTFQCPRLFNNITVLEHALVTVSPRNLLTSLNLKSITSAKKKAIAILRSVGLDRKPNQLCRNLSYGQKKLLEIGCAFAQDNQVILLDEPFAGLDKNKTRIVVNLIKKKQQQGKAVLLVEHNTGLVRSLTDQVIYLDKKDQIDE